MNTNTQTPQRPSAHSAVSYHLAGAYSHIERALDHLDESSEEIRLIERLLTHTGSALARILHP